MKKITALLCALLLCGLLAANAFAAPAPAALEAAGLEVEPGYDWERFRDDNITLNVYNWGEYISTGTDGESLDVNGAFEELTGIKVNYTTFDSNESLRAKLYSGGGNYDVIIPSDYLIGQLVKDDMLAPLDFANIPNYQFIGEEYRNMEYDPENKFSVPYTWGYVGIIYNTTMVDGTINSWNALWDEKYSGNILMFDNSRDAMAIALKRLGLSLNPTSEQEIDLAASELAKQKPLVQAYVMDQIFDKMEGGEAAMAPYYAGDAITMIDSNPDLAFAVPGEGTNYFVDAACIPATSQRKEAAEMYINFLCEPVVSMENTLYIGYSTPNTKAEDMLPDEVKNNPISYPSAEVLENTETFNVLPENLSSHMDKAWSNMRGGVQSGAGWVIPIALVLIVAAVVVITVLRRRAKKNKAY